MQRLCSGGGVRDRPSYKVLFYVAAGILCNSVCICMYKTAEYVLDIILGVLAEISTLHTRLNNADFSEQRMVTPLQDQ